MKEITNENRCNCPNCNRCEYTSGLICCNKPGTYKIKRDITLEIWEKFKSTPEGRYCKYHASKRLGNGELISVIKI